MPTQTMEKLTHSKMDEAWKAKVGWHGYFR